MSDNLKQQTKKGIYWKFAEQFSNYGIQFIIGIVMARLLSPEDFGITALPAVFMAISGVFVSGGFSAALIRKPEIKEKDLSTAFYYSLFVGVLCYVCLFIASPWIAEFYNVPILEQLMRVTALNFLYSPLGTVQSVLLNRKLNFKTPAKISVLCKISSGVVGVGLAYYGFGVWALVVSGLVSGILGVVITFYVVRWYPKTGWSKESFRYLWDFGNKLMGSWLLSTIFENIAPIIIGKFYSPAQLGVYNRAAGYANLPSKNLTATLQSVTYPVLSKIQNDNERLASSYRRILRVSAFVVFPLMMLLGALAHPLVIIMITEKWKPCVILLQIICFSMMWYPIHAISLNLLQVVGRSDLYLRLEVVKKVIGLVILLCTLPFGLVVFCIGNVIISIFSLIVNTFYTGKLLNVGFVMQIKDLWGILTMSVLMFVLILFVNSFIESLYIQLIIGGFVGGVFYLGGTYLLKFQELKDVRYLLKNERQENNNM